MLFIYLFIYFATIIVSYHNWKGKIEPLVQKEDLLSFFLKEHFSVEFSVFIS